VRQLVGPLNPALRTKAAMVVDYDAQLADLIAEMFEVLDSVDGAVALAAPQIGAMQRVVVYSLPFGKIDNRGHMVNPTITRASAKKRLVTEGCLSFPDEFWRVRRAVSCTTAYVDRFGYAKVKEWHGLGAQMVQHELGHLDGVLLPDVAVARVR
jgi:peptide deformylase